MSLETYLRNHFVDKTAFASLAGISMERLDYLIAAKAIPCASYTCDGRSIFSAVFGETPIAKPLTGDYFRPECVRWVTIAHQATTGAERTAVLSTLTHELSGSLEEYCDSKEAIESTVQSFLPHFFNGTFGLCVADPSTGAGIAKKEMLQKKLIEITRNGSQPFPPISRRRNFSNSSTVSPMLQCHSRLQNTNAAAGKGLSMIYGPLLPEKRNLSRNGNLVRVTVGLVHRLSARDNRCAHLRLAACFIVLEAAVNALVAVRNSGLSLCHTCLDRARRAIHIRPLGAIRSL